MLAQAFKIFTKHVFEESEAQKEQTEQGQEMFEEVARKQFQLLSARGLAIPVFIQHQRGAGFAV